MVSVSESNKSNKKDSKDNYKSGAKKRPEVLRCEVLRFKNNKENWIAFIGLDPEGNPYEIFTGRTNDDEGVLSIPKSVTQGNIRKVRNKETGEKRYDFEYVDRFGYLNTIGGIGRIFDDADVLWNYGKMISGMMRHKMPIENVVMLVKNLKFEEETINSWKVGVSRALGKYIEDGTKISGAICPSCKKPGLIFTGGCMECIECGNSKCG